MDATQAYCFACFSTSLSEVHGVLVCDVCGTQTQVISCHAHAVDCNACMSQLPGQQMGSIHAMQASTCAA